MSMQRHMIPAFVAGELDPHLDARSDTDQYLYGLAKCENFVPLNEGPLVKRQGFRFIRPAAPTAQWLTAFRRSIQQEYVVEWSDNAARFYTLGGRIESDANTPYELTTPYSAADAPQLSLQQSFDRLYINHGDYPPAALVRTDPLTFGYEVLGLENGPFTDTNSDTAQRITASGVSGTITLTANTARFTAEHVGALIRLETADFADVKAWEAGMKDISIGDLVRNEGKVYQAATAGKTGSVQPTHDEGAFWDGQGEKDEFNDKGPFGVKWTYLHDRFGICRITGFTTSTSVTATVLRRLPNSLQNVATDRWAHQAFSAAEGWPQLVLLWKGRRFDFKDFDVVGSVAGDFGNGRVNYSAFTSAGTLAADLSFRRTLATEDPPLWVTADRKILVGSGSGELAIDAATNSEALSGSNIDATPQSRYGSEQVYPVQIGTETLFVERGGRRIRMADYEFGRDRYDARDLTAAARHITEGGIIQLTHQRIPHSLLVAVRGDGQLIVHPKTRSEIQGLCRFVMGGDARVLSAVSIVGEDTKTDDLWVLIERENGAGATVREIWQQSAWRELGSDAQESFYVDGGVRISATGGDGSFTGLNHLAGQEVVALVNGVVASGLTVASDGTLDLPASAIPADDYTAIIGLAYTAEAITMRPELRERGAVSRGLRQQFKKIGLGLLESLGLEVGPQSGRLEELIQRRAGQNFDAAIPLESGDKSDLVEAEHERNGRARWVSSEPLPATVTHAMLNIDVSWEDI